MLSDGIRIRVATPAAGDDVGTSDESGDALGGLVGRVDGCTVSIGDAVDGLGVGVGAGVRARGATAGDALNIGFPAAAGGSDTSASPKADGA